MKTLTKSLLALTIINFALGFLFVTGVIKAGDAVGWYMTMPAGAIFFGLFMITFMLQKEVAKFDQEERSRQAEALQAEEATSAPRRHPEYSLKHAH